MRIACILLLASLPLVACGGTGEGPGRTLKNVPRSRTLIMDCAEANACAGQIKDYKYFYPIITGSISGIG